jgi:hypothetical protein
MRQFTSPRTQSGLNIPGYSEFGHHFAGLADGEGHFAIRKLNTSPRKAGTWACSFTIKLRADDLHVLERIQVVTGLGVLYRNRIKQTPGRRNNPAFQWKVDTQAECLALVGIFEQFPLWSKKAAEFKVWSEAVRYWNHPTSHLGINRRGQHRQLIDWTPFEEFHRRLLAAREFVLPLELREAVEA